MTFNAMRFANLLIIVATPPLITVLCFHPSRAVLWVVGVISGAMYAMVNAAIQEVQEREPRKIDP
jgi:hypothetical protein